MKRIAILLVILIVLAAVVIFTADPFGWLAPPTDQPREDEPQQIVLCNVKGADITAFEIDKPDQEPFRLELAAGQWYAALEGKRYKANQERVDKLLELVPGLKSSGLATDKAEKHATFEIDEAQAIGLKVYTGGESPAAEMLVGKATPSYEGTFIRLGSQPEVYRSVGNVKSLVGFAFRDYRTKEPWACEPTTVDSVTVAGLPGTGEKPAYEYDGPRLTFTRQEGLWKTEDGANANQNALTELVDKISKLRVNDFVDEPEDKDTGLAEREPSVVLGGPEGELSLTVGNMEDSQYFVADQDGNIYTLSEYTLKPYLELAFSELTFDDTAAELSEEMEPQEGIENGLPSDSDE